jgi:sugar phosphate isomerase/epimerase
MKPFRKSMTISARLPSPPLAFEAALAKASAAGFIFVDVVAMADRPASHLEALADSGLVVCCGVLAGGAVGGHLLDSPEVGVRREAVAVLKAEISDVARLGATLAVLLPGRDGSEEALARFGEACRLLGEHAGGRMVRLCVEAVTGSALGSAEGVLAWLECLGDDKIELALGVACGDVGMEELIMAIRRAAGRFGNVHVGHNDLASQGNLTEMLTALANARYEGVLSIDLDGSAEPAGRLRSQ